VARPPLAQRPPPRVLRRFVPRSKPGGPQRESGDRDGDDDGNGNGRGNGYEGGNERGKGNAWGHHKGDTYVSARPERGTADASLGTRYARRVPGVRRGKGRGHGKGRRHGHGNGYGYGHGRGRGHGEARGHAYGHVRKPPGNAYGRRRNEASARGGHGSSNGKGHGHSERD
jgi:hypothetical protein